MKIFRQITKYAVVTAVMFFGFSLWQNGSMMISAAKAQDDYGVFGGYRYSDRDHYDYYTRYPRRRPVMYQSVLIDNFRYYPNMIVIREGSTVTWINRDSVPHTVTSVSERFDSGIIRPGERFTMRFNRDGNFNYYCRLHPRMRGSVRVIPSQYGYYGGYGWND